MHTTIHLYITYIASTCVGVQNTIFTEQTTECGIIKSGFLY
jgi:hypothetical protein